MLVLSSVIAFSTIAIKAIAIDYLLFAIALKSDSLRDTTILKAMQKRSHKPLQKAELKSNKYCKFGRAINKLEAIEKNPILLSQYRKNYNATKLFCILFGPILFSLIVCTLDKLII